MNYYFWLGKEGGGSPVYIAVDYALEDHTVIYDGFGNYWQLCGPECELEIVRPGKAQCDYCQVVSRKALGI